MARAAERRVREFNAQNLANTAWAFATVGQKDDQLFKALARMAERRLDQFNGQDFANIAWAFATVGQNDDQLFKGMRPSPLPEFWMLCRGFMNNVSILRLHTMGA